MANVTDLAGERYDEAVPSSPAIVVEHMTKLFADFGLIAPKYSLVQLDWLATPGVKARTSTSIKHKKPARRWICGGKRIPSKSYAEDPLTQSVSH